MVPLYPMDIQTEYRAFSIFMRRCKGITLGKVVDDNVSSFKLKSGYCHGYGSIPHARVCYAFIYRHRWDKEIYKILWKISSTELVINRVPLGGLLIQYCVGSLSPVLLRLKPMV